MEIEINLPSLEAQDIIKVRKSSVTLNDNHLRYLLDFDAVNLKDPEDETLGWTDPEGSYLDVILLKSKIAGIELSNTKAGYWIVVVASPGQDFKIYFDKGAKSKAEVFKAQLITWLLN